MVDRVPSNFSTRQLVAGWSRYAMGFALSMIAALALAAQLNSDILQIPNEQCVSATIQESSDKIANDRLDFRAPGTVHNSTLWEAVEERKTEREYDDDDETGKADQGDQTKFDFTLDIHKSQRTPLQLTDDIRNRISLFVLHHSWKSFLS